VSLLRRIFRLKSDVHWVRSPSPVSEPYRSPSPRTPRPGEPGDPAVADTRVIADPVHDAQTEQAPHAGA
jgi:hypothetical protein